MNRHFDNGSAKSTAELLPLGHRMKIINVKMLEFEKAEIDDLDQILNNLIAWGKSRKAEEIWIPADRKTEADYKLVKLGFKEGAIKAQIPGNAPSGWVLKLG